MQTHFSQKIAFALAIVCYALGVACALGAVFYQGATPKDPIRASLMAAVVFFIGCGVVLHVIGKARLKGVLSGTNHDEQH